MALRNMGATMIVRLALVMLIFAFAARPALSSEVSYMAILSGDSETTKTGSSASGQADIVVHVEAQTVDFNLVVKGLTLSDLSEHLSHAPVGPVHLHIYAPNGDSSLLLPFPMSDAYKAQPDGFSIRVTNSSYADGAKIIPSDITFDAFVRALDSGAVVVNVHSQKFPDGEISGKARRTIPSPAAPGR